MTRLLATKRARNLRRGQTRAEAYLWQALRDRRLGGWKWRRQVPCGSFIADFLCVEAGLVVELDGGQHGDAVGYDARRTECLAKLGLRVVRFWNSSVLESRSDVCDAIYAACGADAPAASPPSLRSPSPCPLPRAGEEEAPESPPSPACGRGGPKGR
ncbi:endonuclease domain-containing protein [Phenylobacterium sp.]|uniref:endonuclease domain-containing protein n=1 Tax=Phenylobacterium sp. TaxID=1871053 RepID=UPI002FCB57E2